MKKIIEVIKKRWIGNTIRTTILIIALILLFIGINMWVQSLDLLPIDMTSEKIYSLSDESKKQIENIEQEVNIYLFGLSESYTLIDFMKQYTSVNENIKSEVVDLTQRPDLAQKYEVTSDDVGIVIVSGEREKILSSYDLYTYDMLTGETIDITEEKVTNAIIEVTIAKKPKIYFLTGHEEYSINYEIASLGMYIQNEVNDVQNLELLVTNKVPDDTDLLVIATPAKDITEYEAQLITDYINLGGKILYLQDPILTNEEFPNMQKVLDLFGVSFDNGVIMEEDASKILLESPNLLIPELSYHSINEDIINEGKIVLVNSSRLKFVEQEKYTELGITVNNIIETSETSYFRKDLQIETLNKVNSDESGVFTVGAEIIKNINNEKQSTLIIYANNSFVSDGTLVVGNQYVNMISLRNNRDFILNTVAYLTEREDTIKIRKDTGTVTYTATEQEDMVIKLIIFIVPVLIIILGIVIWQIRRRKK